MTAPAAPVLSVEELRVGFDTRHGLLTAVNGVSFSIERGRTLCLVGESGSGKSVSATAIMRLITPPGRILSGRVLFEGQDLLQLDEGAMRSVRGRRISMIFQEPMTSLNPVFTVGQQIVEVFKTHEGTKRKEARERAVELLRTVGIPAPDRRVDDYPHQMSGGMRQRVMIAMALASKDPALLIADEPTTALDVTIQAQVLDLLRDMQARTGVSVLLITHDMGVVSELADEVVVLYAGRMVEAAPTAELLANPRHPYTKGLLNSVPSHPKYQGATRLEAIPEGAPFVPGQAPGCPFVSRCALAQGVCRERFPGALDLSDKHRVWCHAVAEGSGA